LVSFSFRHSVPSSSTEFRKSEAKPASVNLTLAALDNLYLFLGLGRPNVRREDKRIETTRRYSLPTEHDRQAAMESLQMEY
jgi:hypothetical protein